MAANKQFWDVVKPFFSNKNLDSDDHVSINDKDKTVKSRNFREQKLSSFSRFLVIFAKLHYFRKF